MRFLNVAGLALVGLYYLQLASKGGGLFTADHLGLVFNDMALRLLQGSFDVDPAVIKEEAFVRNGISYAYFGVFPALLRLPLVPFVDITRCTGPGSLDTREHYAARLKFVSSQVARASIGLRKPFFSISHSAL